MLCLKHPDYTTYVVILDEKWSLSGKNVNKCKNNYLDNLYIIFLFKMDKLPFAFNNNLLL